MISLMAASFSSLSGNVTNSLIPSSRTPSKKFPPARLKVVRIKNIFIAFHFVLISRLLLGRWKVEVVTEILEKKRGEREREREKITDCDLLYQPRPSLHHPTNNKTNIRNSCWTMDEIGSSFSMKLQ